jgi:hypothetical protein
MNISKTITATVIRAAMPAVLYRSVSFDAVASMSGI